MVVINTVNTTQFSVTQSGNTKLFPRTFYLETYNNLVTVKNLNSDKGAPVVKVHFSDIEVDGSTFSTLQALETALLPVVYSVATGGGGGCDLTDVEAKLDTIITNTGETSTKLDTTNSSLSSIDTDTTSISNSNTSIDNKMTTNNTELSDINAELDRIQTNTANVNYSVQFQDTGNIDAFGRLRVSQLTTLYDSKQLYDKLPLFVDEVTSGATATHSASLAKTTLATTGDGDYAIMQTKQRFNYQSGKSQLIFMTFNGFQSETNCIKRIGYFSTNTTAPYDDDYDGLYLENDGADVSVNVALNSGITKTVQSSFNLDTLDGNGASGITADWSKNQILLIDFEWLGVGRVRWGLVIDGLIHYFHQSIHSNMTTDVYMSSPNKPLRWEIRQDGAGTGSFNFICSSVNSEGSTNQIGKIFSDNLGTAFVNANSTANKYAVLGIRLNASNIGAVIDILNFSILSATNDNLFYEVWLNPTVAGTFTYNSITNSSAQIAKGATNGSNTVTGGTLIYSGYQNASSTQSFNIENALRLGSFIDGSLDEFVLTANPLSTNLDVYASLNWREIL